MTNGPFAILSILIPILALVIALVALYAIIQAAIVKALQRARREAWTEDNMPEKAVWLTERQRQQLAEHRDRRVDPTS